MKKVFFTVCAAAIVLASTSCKKEEQSKLDLGALPGKAIITGTVFYDSGYFKKEDVATPYTHYFQPAAGKPVYVEIKKSGEVVKTQTLTTDSNGKYSFEFSASANLALTATVYVNFEGEFKYRKDDKVQTKLVVFEGNGNATLYPAKEVVADIKATIKGELNLDPNE